MSAQPPASTTGSAGAVDGTGAAGGAVDDAAVEAVDAGDVLGGAVVSGPLEATTTAPVEVVTLAAPLDTALSEALHPATPTATTTNPAIMLRQVDRDIRMIVRLDDVPTRPVAIRGTCDTGAMTLRSLLVVSLASLAVLTGCAGDDVAEGDPTSTPATADPTSRAAITPASTAPASTAPATTASATVPPTESPTTVAPTTATPTTTVPVYVFPFAGRDVSYGTTHHDYPAADVFGCGALVLAPTSGTVLETRMFDPWDPAVNDPATRGGLFVSLLGDDGVRYYAAHLETVTVDPGQPVAPGEQLGVMGQTGNARNSACHTHFGISWPCPDPEWEVRRGEIWPAPYLDAWRAGEQRSPATEVIARQAELPDACADAAALLAPSP